MIHSGTMNKILKKGHALIVHLFMMNTKTQGDHEVVDKSIQVVLDTKTQGVFEEPNSLPPIRALDHGIPLKPGMAPISLRPY